MGDGDGELQELRQKIDYLMDRQAILDCIASHAHGQDRHDADVVNNSYHDDGVVMLGKSIVRGPEYGQMLNQTHDATFRNHLHHITTHTVEIDGDTAHAESYVLGAMLPLEGDTASFHHGRYLDRLEKRDGEWRIMVRRVTLEVTGTGDASALNDPGFKEHGMLRGTNDTSDISYVRPLQIDTPAEVW